MTRRGPVLTALSIVPDRQLASLDMSVNGDRVDGSIVWYYDNNEYNIRLTRTQ